MTVPISSSAALAIGVSAAGTSDSFKLTGGADTANVTVVAAGQ